MSIYLSSEMNAVCLLSFFIAASIPIELSNDKNPVPHGACSIGVNFLCYKKLESTPLWA
jgi:hypothetical protein